METLSIRINTIHCYMHEEADGDEVFLKLNGKKIWPENDKFFKMKEQTENVGVIVNNLPVNSFVELEVWDFDFLSPNDLLGKVKMMIDKPGGPYTSDIQLVDEKQMGRYAVVWEILRQQ